MAMETISTKRKRVYKRKFDHDAAIAMAAKGFNANEIQRHMGLLNVVSVAAIKRVIDPRTREQMDRNTTRWLMSGVCKKCGGPRARTTNRHQERGLRDSGLCRKCWGESRQNRYQLEDGVVVSVRCGRCRKWYPAKEFPKHKGGTRGFHTSCTRCNTEYRRKYRTRKRLAGETPT